jgi:hypothetical protein
MPVQKAAPPRGLRGCKRKPCLIKGRGPTPLGSLAPPPALARSPIMLWSEGAPHRALYEPVDEVRQFE